MTTNTTFFLFKGDNTGNDAYPEICLNDIHDGIFKCSKCENERMTISHDALFLNRHGKLYYLKRKWPDILKISAATKCLVNDQVVQDLHNAGIKNFKTHPVRLDEVPEKKKPQWNYWLIEPLHREVRYVPIMDDYKEKDLLCTHCGLLDLDKFFIIGGRPEPRFILNEKTATHHDIVWVVKKREYDIGFSERIVDLAHEKKWTNAMFVSMENKINVYPEHQDWRERLKIADQKKDEERRLKLQAWYEKNLSINEAK